VYCYNIIIRCHNRITKMDLKEIVCEHEDWIHVIQESGRVQWRDLTNTAINIFVPYKGLNLLAGKGMRFSRRNLLHGSI
jgi:hypothetical protein